MSNIQGRSEKELVLVFVFCDLRTFEDKVAEVSVKSEESLKVSSRVRTPSTSSPTHISYSPLGWELKIFSAAPPEVQS